MTVNTPTTGMPSGPEFARSLIQRAWEAPEEVVFPRYLIDSPGLQAEDIGVLAHLLLRDTDRPSSVAALATECQQRGWKISEYAMRAIVKRLKQAGHVHQDRVYNKATGRLDWVFTVYRNPANNRAYVNSVTEEMPSSGRFVGSQQIGQPDSSAPNESAGQADSLNPNESGAIRWDSTNRDLSNVAGQGRYVGSQRIGAHPPHPPEEVETSSPYPLKQSAAPTEEAGERFTPEQIADAERFLQLLPGPWAAGRKTAQRLAPKLLDAADAQGWDLDDALATQLTEKPDGVHRYAAVLATRIDDLPLYAAVHRTPAALTTAAPPTALPIWCEDLDCDEETRLRCITDDRGFRRTGPCPDCHPNTQAQEAA
ncbi:hypothetical protein [Kitasatospora sp. NBC_01302]|uniref:hypothetical protein n=1 Tax=Kitasatospora sp. NBC_01302 TaxID=2903575 RepID=UPI002E12C513|nr:hypothetical protein OG294_14115 [Kitasatospora sp. NBC_01302]